jgi:hypothetical protein
MNTAEKVEMLSEKTVLEAVKRGEFVGMTHDISNTEYHSHPGLSFTGIKQFSETPASYQAYLRTEKDPTDDQRLGTLVHMMVLEPETVEKRITVIDGTWAHKIKEKVEEARAAGLFPCKTKEVDKARAMSSAVLSHPSVKRIFEKGKAEQSIYWKEQVRTPSGDLAEVLCKCRPDWMRDDGLLVDLKWFNNLNLRALEKQIFRQKYYMQSAWYLRGAGTVLGRRLNAFAHIFISEADPYLCRVVILNDAAIEKGEEEALAQLPRFAECTRSGIWPGYPDSIETLTLPDYAWTDWVAG